MTVEYFLARVQFVHGEKNFKVISSLLVVSSWLLYTSNQKHEWRRPSGASVLSVFLGGKIGRAISGYTKKFYLFFQIQLNRVMKLCLMFRLTA